MYFSFDNPDDVLDYARSLDLIPNAGPGAVERPGEGNMNFVVRLRAGNRSVVLKQSRPWVQKYPSIEAPVNRIHTEVAFYRLISGSEELRRRMPRLLHYDPDRFVAVFEDIGNATDYTSLYAEGRHAGKQILDDVKTLLHWLSVLHGIRMEAESERIRNREMRTLNHAHMFEIPLESDNGIDPDTITPGLGRSSDALRSDTAYVRAVAELGRIYLSDGTSLLHGDFYPGSWVRSATGPMVIDPEFAFHGPAEFDLGVCRAHLMLSGVKTEVVDELFAACSDAPGTDPALIAGFAGIEIMRRLLGVAQLPLDRSLEQKERLLSLSRELILGSGL